MLSFNAPIGSTVNAMTLFGTSVENLFLWYLNVNLVIIIIQHSSNRICVKCIERWTRIQLEYYTYGMLYPVENNISDNASRGERAWRAISRDDGSIKTRILIAFTPGLFPTHIEHTKWPRLSNTTALWCCWLKSHVTYSVVLAYLNY